VETYHLSMKLSPTILNDLSSHQAIWVRALPTVLHLRVATLRCRLPNLPLEPARVK
jgi:hypothetical protein